MDIAKKLVALVLIFILAVSPLPVFAVELQEVAENFGRDVTDENAHADLNADGFINALDISEVLRNYGQGGGNVALPQMATMGALTAVRVSACRAEIAVEVTTDGTAYLDVAVISDTSDYGTDWTTGNILTSGRARIAYATEGEFVYAAVLQTLPQYFIVVATLTNDYGEEITDQAVFINYTRIFAQFAAATIYDFEPETVINLDDSTDENFMVVTDSAALIRMTERSDYFQTSGENTFTFYNAQSDIFALQAGDKIVVVAICETMHLIHIAAITVNGADITITAHRDFCVTYFFRHITISVREYLHSPDITAMFMPHRNYPFSRNFRAVFSGAAGNFAVDAWIGLDVYIIAEIEYSVEWSFFVPTGVSLWAKFGVGVAAEIDVTSVATSAPASGSGAEISVFSGNIPIKWGFNAALEIDLLLDWNAQAEGNVNIYTSATAGIIFNNGSVQTFTNRGGPHLEPRFEGNLYFSIGPRIAVALDWLDLINAAMWVHPRVTVDATAFFDANRPMVGNSHHACDGCLAGQINFILDAGFDATYSILIFSGTIINRHFPNMIRHRLGAFHFSFGGGERVFGRGECPNILYRVTFHPRDAQRLTLDNAWLEVRNQYGYTVAQGEGSFYTFLHRGRYSVTAEYAGETFTRYFTVLERANAVVIPMFQGDFNGNGGEPAPIRWRQVVAGNRASFAIRMDDSLWGWGANADRELGDGTGIDRHIPVRILDDVVSVSRQQTASMMDGSVAGWGWDRGQLASGAASRWVSPPMRISSNVKYYTLLTDGGRAIQTDGTLWTWGRNNFGQLGIGTVSTAITTWPVRVLDNVVAVSGSGFRSAAITADGSLWAWGADSAVESSPSPVHLLDDVISVSVGQFYTLVIKADNSFWAWGSNISTTPIRIMDDVAVIIGHNLVKRTDGSIWVWRSDHWAWSGIPEKVIDNVAYVYYRELLTHHGMLRSSAFVIREDGGLWAWGPNFRGQIGDGTEIDRNAPVFVMDGVKAVSVNHFHVMAIKTDNSLWAWGDNEFGQVGNGTTINQSTPVKIMEDVKYVSAGVTHALAIKTDGTLWAWGSNSHGQLGDGTTTDRHTPMQVLPSALPQIAAFDIPPQAAVDIRKESVDSARVGQDIYRMVFSANASGGFDLFSAVFSYDNGAIIPVCSENHTDVTGIAQDSAEPAPFRILKNDSNGVPFSHTQTWGRAGNRTGVNFAAFCLPQYRPYSHAPQDVFAFYFRIVGNDMSLITPAVFRFENANNANLQSLLSANFGIIIDGAENLYVHGAICPIATFGREPLCTVTRSFISEAAFISYLSQLITNAEELLRTTRSSPDGRNIPISQYWATPCEHSALQNAINAARSAIKQH
ncbi:MAG: hypothetical protein FWB96_07665 [Defluviitaleaceae bacterium]|nr:hypothetical protein [Defluviitaleaceae bacterium]MCL2262802.1 hypothetical protein [Defluviitaleaceae bacterium]